jgi:hypothetical protein
MAFIDKFSLFGGNFVFQINQSFVEEWSLFKRCSLYGGGF